MCKKKMKFVVMIALLSLAGNCMSANCHWTGAGGDRDFSNPDNWGGTIPGPGDLAFQWPPGQGAGATTEGPIIDETVTVQTVGIGWKWAHAKEDTPTVIWEIVPGGELTVTGSVLIGRQNAWGQLDMNGGKMTVNGTLNVGTGGNSIGKINLGGPDGGGTLEVTGTLSFGGGGSDNIDIDGDTLIIDGNDLETIQGYIDNGLITAYDGDGTLHLDYDVTNPGKTTVTAIHNLNPNPAHGRIVTPGAVALSWTLPDPCTPGQPVPVDVYFTDNYDALAQFTDPAAIQVVSKQNVTSVVVQTQTKTRYFWAVDTYIGSDNDPILGPIFSFLADNAPPSVNAGPDISTFLQDGTRTGPVSGTVTDDGAIQPYTVTWSVVEQPSDADSTLPGAVIADPTAEQTMVTVFAEGIYVLQLEANDGEYTSSDTMMINVHPDDWTN